MMSNERTKTSLRTRRAAILGASHGLGRIALAGLVAGGFHDNAIGAASAKVPPHTPRAKRVIWLSMAGGPSQFETFDPKPALAAMDGQPMPPGLTAGQQLAQLQGQELVCKGPQFRFRRYGQSAAEISELLPHIGSLADDICIVRSMTTDAINHDPAHMFMNTGSQIAGRPSMGAWVTYGLGSESQNLPGFVVMVSTGPGRSPQPIAARQWSSGFLPGKFQGVQLRSTGDPVLYLNSPPGVTRAGQRADVDAIRALNERYFRATGDADVQTRIAQYEMAFRLQSSVPELTELSAESPATLASYGCQPGDGSFASNCLLARRLAERGVRFIQLYHRDWDHHSQLREELPLRCREVDQPCAALVRDLQQRGLFEDTLLVWSGEFGRTPMAQQNKGTVGRDHHNKSMSLWLCGGGIRGGLVYGATDDLGYAAVDNVATVHDLHATMLHLLGIPHESFSVPFQGLDARLTGVEPASVMTGILS
jgi:hypothetical protein